MVGDSLNEAEIAMLMDDGKAVCGRLMMSTSFFIGES